MDKDTILITGLGGSIGRLLLKKLHRDFNVIGIDRRDVPGIPKDVIHYKFDITRNRVENIFKKHKISAIFHLGVMHNLRVSDSERYDFNIYGTSKLLDYAKKYSVPKFIFLSSSDVYGPKYTNSQFLTEDQPLMAGAKFSRIRDLVALDMMVSSYFWKNPETEIIILRASHIVGNINNGFSNYLKMNSPLFTIFGFNPMVQVIDQRDLLKAFIKAYEVKGVKGIFNISSKGEMPLLRVIEYLGKKYIPLPELILKLYLKETWKFKLKNFPVDELDHIKYVCMIDTKRAKDILNFKPDYTIMDALDSIENSIKIPLKK